MVGLTKTCLLAAVLASLTCYTECCQDDKECEWKAHCTVNGSCQCDEPGYTLHDNSRDCRLNRCLARDCLECDAGELRCTRCVYFLEESSRECLDTCNGEAKFVYSGPLEGSICISREESDNTDVIIGVIAGVSAGLLLCIIVLIGFCIHIRRTRRNVNLNQTNYVVGNMQAGNVKKMPIYDNQGFDVQNEPSLVHNVVDREVYLHEIDKLKPYAQELLTILNELRAKLRAMDQADPRVPTYKGVIHQLCRVLVLLHKRDPGVSIPSDALGLFEWAHQMIEDRQMDVEPADDTLESNPVNKISYVEVPASSQHQPQQHSNHSNPYATPVIKKPPANPYATLNKRHSQLNMAAQSQQSFYSSVPIPGVNMTPTSPHTNHVSVSQNNSLKSNKENLKRQYEIPWDLKFSESITTLNCSGSDLTMGYFSNGRYYDPTPRNASVRKKEESAEIYAPASSYSDNNQPRLSTFAGGIPRNQSFSSSQTSSENTITSQQGDGEGEYEGRMGDDEPFPFDINDATEPVEV